MTKRAFIIHGWDFNSKMHWYPWLKLELEKKGYEVITPNMPNTSTPKIEEWVSHLKKIADKLDDETLLIGHSMGCQTIMRYLETNTDKAKVNVLFVAGWFNLINLEDKEVEEIASPWLKTKIDLDKVKAKIKSLKVFVSDNDPYNCLTENIKIFKEQLNAKIIVLKNKGHFTENDSVNKIPEVLNEI